MNAGLQPDTAKKKSRRRLIVAILLVGVLAWAIGCTVLAVTVAWSLGWLGGEGLGPLVTISKETTYIVEPLRGDGYVDYVAALNERTSEGVTPENNAAVLLWQALGPAEILGDYGEEGSRRFFEELGMPRPPDEGEYFVPSDRYIQELEEAGPPPDDQKSHEQAPGEEEQGPHNWWTILREQEDRASERPWSGEEFPELAAWLDRNEAPLRLVLQASRKERFYSPLIPPEASPPLICVLLPGPHRCRDVCRALEARAMLRLHEGKVDEAWQDLLACHRWARLVGQGPTMIEALVAFAIEGIACCGDAAVAHHGNLTSDEIKHMQADFEDLGPLPKMVDKIDVAERFQFLDSTAALAREGPGAMDASGDEESRLEELLWEWGGNRAFDWDTILRKGNTFFDRLVEAGRIADRSDRRRAVSELDDEIEREIDEVRDPMSLAKSFVSRGPRKTVTEKIGQIMLALLTPALSAALDAEDRAVVTFRMAKTSLALAAYRADHGSSPEKLDQLVPKYLGEAPQDVFTEGELRYKPSGDDYLLYSVGPNGEDEEGRAHESEPSGDDVVIHTAPSP